VASILGFGVGQDTAASRPPALVRGGTKRRVGCVRLPEPLPPRKRSAALAAVFDCRKGGRAECRSAKETPLFCLCAANLGEGLSRRHGSGGAVAGLNREGCLPANTALARAHGGDRP
jgi:hypothetical protein